MTDELSALLAELTCGDDARAEAAVSDLAGRGDVILPALKALLNSAEVDARWWSIRTLAQMSAPPSDWLIAALADSTGEVRQCALLALCLHPDADAIPALIRLLADPEPVSAELASSALTAIGSQAVPALIESLENDGAHKARLEAVRALSAIRDPRAILSLMAALEEDSLAMQFWAEAGLERLGLGMVYLKPE
ncbi:MAG: HEAT repeat domain-containing protein [Anaerolineales bacterium]|nr:HEAT repeat domain-containing protein [Anaerolineales bacterium]